MKIKTPQPKNKLEAALVPTLQKVSEIKSNRGIKLTIYKNSGLKDLPQELIDYEKERLENYMPHRVSTKTGNIDLGILDALVVRKWGVRECVTVVCALLARPFDKASQAIYENMAERTCNKTNERLKLNFDNRV